MQWGQLVVIVKDYGHTITFVPDDYPGSLGPDRGAFKTAECFKGENEFQFLQFLNRNKELQIDPGRYRQRALCGDKCSP